MESIFEELDEIREDLPEADWHSEWVSRKLKYFAEYKAEYEGLFVDVTNPRNTSDSIDILFSNKSARNRSTSFSHDYD
jgi:hypothetical protein